jgi:hypothetical protein
MNELIHSYNKSREGKREFHKLLKVRLAQHERSRDELEEYLAKKLGITKNTASTQLTSCNFKEYEKAVELIEQFFEGV